MPVKSCFCCYLASWLAGWPTNERTNEGAKNSSHGEQICAPGAIQIATSQSGLGRDEKCSSAPHPRSRPGGGHQRAGVCMPRALRAHQVRLGAPIRRPARRLAKQWPHNKRGRRHSTLIKPPLARSLALALRPGRPIDFFGASARPTKRPSGRPPNGSSLGHSAARRTKARGLETKAPNEMMVLLGGQLPAGRPKLVCAPSFSLSLSGPAATCCPAKGLQRAGRPAGWPMRLCAAKRIRPTRGAYKIRSWTTTDDAGSCSCPRPT